MTKAIETIIFDFGGVLIDIEPAKTAVALAALGLPLDPKIYQPIVSQYDKGLIDAQAFFHQMAAHSKKKAHKSSFIKAWNAMLLDVPEARIWFLKKLQKHYKLILLSNTNDTHIRAIKKQMGPFHFQQFISCFDGVYFSFEHGMQKPDEQFFKKVLLEQKIKPETTLFVEDTLENLIPAEALGIQTYFHERNGDIITGLRAFLRAATITQ